MARMKAELQISVRIGKIMKGLLACYLCDKGYPKRAQCSSVCRLRASSAKNDSYYSICYVAPTYKERTANNSFNSYSNLKEKCCYLHFRERVQLSEIK